MRPDDSANTCDRSADLFLDGPMKFTVDAILQSITK